ncbi:DNA repair helicase Rad25 [Natrialba magadii ATCC 43099]|uniref:DNA 3'-5' helicase n=1 Tax=Natrialba magadii (strain ATCC 43099 / DSM 3394 / CCM 3739 / CIP 104546 / IAM 13178 / JCM 8861 / NBRC 102185 / NCIMB 2190 / MS3) TaxID=547559 RepID=D3SZB0_NATMM|nr:DEAD/DEAH box helicase family protein [Natrialba magadii]ADD04244.1 DNA repair helicase Rad25 [Natrialba magadii ATCC 43099]ELY26647.1 type III restriction protein res subunit [Natrialba magadii ATCC 43099]
MYLSPRTPSVSRPSDSTPITLRYEDGTIRLDARENTFVESLRDDVAERALNSDLELEFKYDRRTDTIRTPAFRYAAIRRTLRAASPAHDVATIDIDDRALDLPDLPTGLHSAYELRPYQREALESWLATDRWADLDLRAPTSTGERAPAGVLELPTGSGKTVIALKAIERLGVPTLVVVPTIDLLEQWQRELESEFDCAVGRFGGGEQRREPITVSTYDSAYLKADSVGDRFGLVVFDEVHHLGGEGYREIARLLAAPARLGLTATFERPDEAHEIIEEIVGPLVHRVDVDELAGDHLAAYDVKRLEVSLTAAEREEYEAKQGVFSDYLARSNIRMQSGSDYQELVKRSGNDPAAREALLARQRAREIARGSEAKLDALQDILDHHREDRIIVFTASNDLAYDVSERFLIPTITHQTGAAERRALLESFRDGTYARIATSNVLDEGVDVPDANVAVVLSGSGSEREFTQRLGRILRPKTGGAGGSGSTDSGLDSSTDQSADDISAARAGRAILYEVVSADTSEVNAAERRS